MIEMLIGVNVVDDVQYDEYRARMTPLLTAHGGAFVVDVRVSQVLLCPTDKPFNRLFTIRFPSNERLEAFFSDPEYLKIRKAYFEPSVSDATRLVRYEVP